MGVSFPDIALLAIVAVLIEVIAAIVLRIRRLVVSGCKTGTVRHRGLRYP
jgi:hypothetical protein